MLKEWLERLRLVTEYTEDDMKDFSKFHRMKEDKKLQFLEMRIEMEQYKAEREAELAEITEAMDALDYAETVSDSFQGGPGGENDNTGEGYA